MKRTAIHTEPDAGPTYTRSREPLEAANVALRDELAAVVAVIDHAKQRAENAEADLAEARDERDAHAARISELERHLAEVEVERDFRIADMKEALTATPIPAPVVTAPEAAPADSLVVAAIAAVLVEIIAANERKHPTPRQRKAAAKPTTASRQPVSTFAKYT